MHIIIYHNQNTFIQTIYCQSHNQIEKTIKRTEKRETKT